MKVYIACHDKHLAQETARNLPSSCLVVSRWHEGDFLPTQQYSELDRHKIAMSDLSDIKLSDALILVAGPEKYSGGKFVEAGIAYGMGKPVYVIGRFENMLTYLFEPWSDQ